MLAYQICDHDADDTTFWTIEEPTHASEEVMDQQEITELFLSDLSDTDKDFLILELVKRVEE